MSENFCLTLEEQFSLIKMARCSILCGFLNNDISAQINNFNSPDLETLYKPFGTFITIKVNGYLRGCIGTVSPSEPLYCSVPRMAYAAAFQDSRFSPLTLTEWKQSYNEISILGPLEKCTDVNTIEIGKHGLLLKKDNYSGVFLPKVPVEQGWDMQAYLQNLCAKANLPPLSWEDKKASLFTFETFTFSFDANIKDGHHI